MSVNIQGNNNSPIRIISWNINGTQNPTKLKKCLLYLKSRQADVVLLQETHMKSSEAMKLRRGWVGHVFHSSFDSKKRGVAILVHKKLKFVLLKEHKDEEGRVVCIESIIDGKKINLCNIYAPNEDDPDFFHKINSLLGTLQDGCTILGGDFNQTLDPVLDRSKYSHASSKGRVALGHLQEDIGLVDIWRLMNPGKREYTFYSHNHKSHSRIDYYLISKDLIESVIDAAIGVIALADHAPVELCVSISVEKIRSNRWRLNTSLLQNTVFKQTIAEDLTNFFQINIGSTPKIGTVWEASKAYIRGKIIAEASKRKKQDRETITRLENQIKHKERELSENFSEDLLKQVCELKYSLNLIYSKKAEYAMFRLKASFYESGEKAGKLLARQLKKQENAGAIAGIKTSKGKLVTTPKDINQVFMEFYKKLYTSDTVFSHDQLKTWFSKIQFPSLLPEQVQHLDAPIREEEIRKAICSMQSGKAPGLDGFPVEYYKLYIDILVPVLTKVYSESLSVGQLPDTLNESVISIILKKGRDSLDPASYRPISLANVDYKILTKVLAMRLENVVPCIVDPDQVGFVKGRSSSDNLRRLLHLMWQNRESDEPVAAFSLDAEKAFDRVEWRFLIHVLESFGFGQGFIRWIQLIYAEPKAAVLTNGIVSSFFNIYRGAKQGDPLSPLLFIIFLEPLAMAVRSETNIRGVRSGGREHKLFLYADDILWLSVNPVSSAPKLLEIMGTFSEISGYKINWHKSEVMPVSRTCLPTINNTLQFKWMDSGMQYLGICLTPDINDMIQANFFPLLQPIKANLDKWRRINLSLWGKIHTIKMIVAPQVNYISMMVPLTVPDSFFKQYNQIIKDFLWNGKKPRIKLEKLYATRSRGGLALPNLELYRIAFEVFKIAKHWGGDSTNLGWLAIEREVVSPFGPIEALSQASLKGRHPDPILQYSRETWAKVHKHMRISQYKQTYSSIWDNPSIKVGRESFVWNTWLNNNISRISDLYGDSSTFHSFEELKRKFNLRDKADFWKYLQMRSCVQSLKVSFDDDRNKLLCYLRMPELMRNASTFYKLMADSLYGHYNYLKGIWERDLNSNIQEEVWKDMVFNAGWPVRDALSKFTHYKVIHRYYYTPVKLHRMGLMKDNLCWKCQNDTGSYLHLLWECPMVFPFWKQVIKTIGEWLDKPLPESPQLCLLGDRSLLPPEVSKAESALALAGFISAVRIILRHWKSHVRPGLTDWLKLMTDTASFEDLIARLNDGRGKFCQVWSHFLHFIKVQLPSA